MSEPPTSVRQPDLAARLEALLFVASGPVSPLQLASALELTVEEINAGLHDLEARFKQNGGLSLQWHQGKVQLTTEPAMATDVERFLGIEATSRLSRAALETLAIIAYQQPVTRPQMEAIRGVNSDAVIKSLLSKGLIQEIGRAESPGRPIMYGTTPEFLQYFGLSALSELPPLETEGTGTTSGNNQILKG